MKIAMKNHPEIIQLGDITKWKAQGFKPGDIDLLIGGSPCQGFSNAGKGLNFDDPRSKLFFEFVELLKYLKPKYFLLENVKMKKEWQDVISGLLGVEPILVNSALVSAQNRKRNYWCNWEVEQPEDKGILLKDVIENGFTDRDKSRPIVASVGRTTPREYFKKSQGQLVFVDKSQTIPATLYKENAKSMIKRKKFGLLVGYNYDSTTIVRKVTPVECERLQTLPDDYTEGASNTQRYKMLGNGWTVSVIEHIFKAIKCNQ